MTKAEIRKDILAKRDNLTEKELQDKSRAIFEKLIDTEEYKEAEYILIYASFGSEVRTDEIILDSLAMGKNVYCPKVIDRKNGEMIFAKISSLEDLKPGYAGIREPDYNELSDIFVANYIKDAYLCKILNVIPGVAFDHSLNRIGYSGGFYDRFMGKYSNVNTIALAFDIQVVNFDIPKEFHDKTPKMIITEKLNFLYKMK